jgi:ubiquinone/menaquinone biosynthesis C-methylase UbiE
MKISTKIEAESMARMYPKPPEIEWYENIKLPTTWGLINKRLTGKKVLDIGCATGWITYWANKQGADCMATDIFDSNINPDIPHMIADKEELPFPDETFDFVLTANVLHHGDLTKTAQEVLRVLKKGGELVSFQEPCIPDEMVESEYLEAELKKELDLGLDEHRPSLKRYKEALNGFSRVDYLKFGDQIFIEPGTTELVQLTDDDYFGGIAIRAIK